jgi:neutral ceramidase
LLATISPVPCHPISSQVVKRLKAKYGDLYTDDNVLISGTHTHSGPAGYFQYVLFEVSTVSIMYLAS